MIPAKTVEPIEIPFGLWTRLGPRKHVLVWVTLRHLVNVTELSMCVGDRAFLLNYSDHLLLSIKPEGSRIKTNTTEIHYKYNEKQVVNVT